MVTSYNSQVLEGSSKRTTTIDKTSPTAPSCKKSKGEVFLERIWSSMENETFEEQRKLILENIC